MLRSKRKKLENGDGCLDSDTNMRPGDIASAGFAVQGKQTQMEYEQPSDVSVEGTDQNLELFEEGEDE